MADNKGKAEDVSYKAKQIGKWMYIGEGFKVAVTPYRDVT